LEKESTRHDIQLDQTGLANTVDGGHLDHACYENVQYSNVFSVNSGSDSTVRTTKERAEWKSQLLDAAGALYEPLQGNNRGVILETTYEKLRKPLNV
jgi:hypothetical protein